MCEGLRGEQIAKAKENSRRFEKSWRVYCHPGRHSFAEVKAATDFIRSQVENFKIAMTLEGFEADRETLEKVFLGVFHYPGFEFPVEIKYKYFNN